MLGNAWSCVFRDTARREGDYKVKMKRGVRATATGRRDDLAIAEEGKGDWRPVFKNDKRENGCGSNEISNS